MLPEAYRRFGEREGSAIRFRLVPLAAATLLAVLGACQGPGGANPVPYDPAEGGWTLHAANDFSTSLTTVDIPNLLIEGDASVTLENGKLVYAGDSAPDDRMWLRTDYGFFDATRDYKLYVEPVGELERGGQHIAFTARSEREGTSISAVLRSNELELRADGGPADEVFGQVARGEDLDSGRYAFELIVESYNLTARVVDLETSVVGTAVGGTLDSLAYYDGHDLRLRCGYSGTISLDAFRIYTR